MIEYPFLNDTGTELSCAPMEQRHHHGKSSMGLLLRTQSTALSISFAHSLLWGAISSLLLLNQFNQHIQKGSRANSERYVECHGLEEERGPKIMLQSLLVW